MWFIGVEVEQETSAPPPKKILDPPLNLGLEYPQQTPRCEQKRSIHAFASVECVIAAMSVRSKSLRYFIVQTGKICPDFVYC